MSEIGEFLVGRLGKEYFAVEDDEYIKNRIPRLGQNNPNRIVIGLIRETVAPFINRSTVPDETITANIGVGENIKEVVEVPARKFKSKEKLLGIRLCKLYGVMDKSYRYNSLDDIKQLNNPASAIFGDTLVLGENAGTGMLPSRVLYSSSYSVIDKSIITERLTHNALSDNGTMWDAKEGKNRQSLFETEYVVPGTYFPAFLTLIDPTPEALYFVLATLKETSYGAQTSITGSNFKNNVVFIMGCHNEPAISSYTISRDWDSKIEINMENLTKFMLDSVKSNTYSSYQILEGSELEELEKYLDNVPYEISLNSFKDLSKDVDELLNFANFGKKGDRSSGNSGKKKDIKSQEE